MPPLPPAPGDPQSPSRGAPQSPSSGDSHDPRTGGDLPEIQPGWRAPSWTADWQPDWVGEHFADPHHRGRLGRATHAAEREFPCCGDPRRTLAADDPVAVVDAIGIELRVARSGEIREAWFEGSGCQLCQAAASRLVERVERLTVEQAKRFSAAEMLRCLGHGVPLERQRCALLAWRAFQKALDCPLAYDDSDAPHDLIGEDDDQVPRRFGGPSLEEES